jgi:hypothetical protein
MNRRRSLFRSSLAVPLCLATNDPSQLLGGYWWDSYVTPSTTVAREQWDWPQHIVSRTHIVWGTTVDPNLAAWSLRTPWSSDATRGSHIVWGTHVVLGADGVVWAGHIVWGTSLVGTNVDGKPHRLGDRGARHDRLGKSCRCPRSFTVANRHPTGDRTSIHPRVR